MLCAHPLRGEKKAYSDKFWETNVRVGSHLLGHELCFYCCQKWRSAFWLLYCFLSTLRIISPKQQITISIHFQVVSLSRCPFLLFCIKSKCKERREDLPQFRNHTLGHTQAMTLTPALHLVNPHSPQLHSQNTK